MADITIPYDEDTISGAFTYDITNNRDEITIFTEGLSAGTITVSFMDGTTARALKSYTADAQDIIEVAGRNVRVSGTDVTCNYLSIA